MPTGVATPGAGTEKSKCPSPNRRPAATGQHCRGIARHMVRGVAQLSFKSVKRHFGFGKAWRRTGEGVAGEAAVGKIEALAVQASPGGASCARGKDEAPRQSAGR
jgi:hypothetical protein